LGWVKVVIAVIIIALLSRLPKERRHKSLRKLASLSRNLALVGIKIDLGSKVFSACYAVKVRKGERLIPDRLYISFNKQNENKIQTPVGLDFIDFSGDDSSYYKGVFSLLKIITDDPRIDELSLEFEDKRSNVLNMKALREKREALDTKDSILQDKVKTGKTLIPIFLSLGLVISITIGISYYL
jgi:hypothetical protein